MKVKRSIDVIKIKTNVTDNKPVLGWISKPIT